MPARDFFVGFMRGLNSVSEVFAPYAGGHGGYVGHEGSPILADGRRSSRPITRFVSARWRGPLPPSSELEKIEQMIPGGAERLLQMAEKEQASRIPMAEKEQVNRIQLAEKEQAYRIEDSRRGQWLGWFLAAGALSAAAVVSLFHAPWQVSVALVGIPMLGAVQALIQGRKEKGARRRTARWF